MANRELGRIDRIRCVLDSIDSAVLECNRVRAVLQLRDRDFYICLNERDSGKQLLVRGGIWQELIDIWLSVFPFFIVTGIVGFSGCILDQFYKVALDITPPQPPREFGGG